MEPAANLDTVQAARHLGFTQRTLELWRCEDPPKGPPCWKAGNGRTDGVRYSRVDLDAWIAQRKTGWTLADLLADLGNRAGMLKELIPKAHPAGKSWVAQGRYEGMLEAVDALRAYEHPAQDGAWPEERIADARDRLDPDLTMAMVRALADYDQYDGNAAEGGRLLAVAVEAALAKPDGSDG